MGSQEHLALFRRALTTPSDAQQQSWLLQAEFQRFQPMRLLQPKPEAPVSLTL